RLTTARYFTPSGRSIQAKGISPDIEVLQDVPEELKARTDTRGEASLRGHLKAEGDEQTGSQSYIPPDPKDDKALHTGLDLIRGPTTAGASKKPRLPRRIRSPRCRTSPARTCAEPGAACGPPRCFSGAAILSLRAATAAISADARASRAPCRNDGALEHAPLQILALSPLRRHGGIQSQGARLYRPPHRRTRACRRHARVAAAARRHRSRRGSMAGGATRAL